MKIIHWINQHARHEILVLSALSLLFSSFYYLGALDYTAGYIIARVFYLLLIGGLYAILCITQFFPSKRTKIIALSAFLFYYSINRLSGIVATFTSLTNASDSWLITYDTFLLLAISFFLVFLVFFLIQLFLPKVHFPRFLPYLFLMLWIGFSCLAMIFGIVFLAKNNATWNNYFSTIGGNLIRPVLFLVAYCSLCTEKETVSLNTVPTQTQEVAPSEEQQHD